MLSRLEIYLDMPDDKASGSKIPLWSRAGFLIRRLNQIHYALFLRESEGYDLTPVQYGVLTKLAEQPDLDQITLSQEVGIDRSNTADILRRLEGWGLVKRSPSPNDKRVRLSRLTEKGEQVTQSMYDCMLRAQELLLEPLTPEERKAFSLLLAKLVHANNHLGRAVFRPS
ncbi:MAG: MarR family transcriptional regulator [Saccharospirillum sp.]|nr:MarR family transcriptional regulator [Saccharospirillum sp.]